MNRNTLLSTTMRGLPLIVAQVHRAATGRAGEVPREGIRRLVVVVVGVESVEVDGSHAASWRCTYLERVPPESTSPRETPGMANWWEEPALTGIGRLPMRPPLVDRDGPWFRVLDGRWRFSLAARPDAVPDGFTDAEFDDGGWAEVDVPGCWTMQGFDRPIYTNYAMPFRTFPPDVPDDNPTGCYRTRFTVPDEWRDRRVVLHVGAAESVPRAG